MALSVLKTTMQFVENERLAALDRYDILDTPSDPSLDRITRIVATAFRVPMASISLIDGHRQWLKSRHGGLSAETCKNHAFCSTTIQMTKPLVIEDATKDPRFRDNPLVIGPPHIRFYAGAPLCTPDGYNLGALCAIDTQPRRLDEAQIGLLKDLADMVMSEFEANKLARTDSLTGVLSRRGFKNEGERALALSVRHSHPLSCIMFDLDHFKAINDVHGHAVGDRILVEAANISSKRLRRSDIFGRIGGEEFAILLPYADAARALNVAEELRGDLAGLLISLPGDRVHISASFGIADRERSKHR
jgi:diguanylate cyclase (GGDEF)-like protein